MGNDLKDQLDSVTEAADSWESLQDDEPKDAELIKEAREELEAVLSELDVTSVCKLVHGVKGHGK
jgi:hypothetical protein